MSSAAKRDTRFHTLTLKSVKIGGTPVTYNRVAGTLTLAGEEVKLADWLETRRRIDLLMKHEMTPEEWQALREQLAWLGKRDRLPNELRDYEHPRSTRPTGLMERLRFWWAQKRLGVS